MWIIRGISILCIASSLWGVQYHTDGKPILEPLDITLSPMAIEITPLENITKTPMNIMVYPVDDTSDTDGDGVLDTEDSDDDNDGISDENEHIYGLDPKDKTDATKDNDNDGYDNKTEIEAGSDPNESSSTPNTLESKSVTLSSGWNLMGIESGMTLGELIEQVGSENLLVIHGLEKTYNKAYADNDMDSLNDFVQLERGKGYWIKVAQEVSLHYTPLIYADKSIRLQQGWNLINPLRVLTLNEILTQVGISNLLVIQGANSSYYKENVDIGQSQLNTFIGFEEDQGYWIKVNSDATLAF